MKLSILIPSYNGAKVIKETLRSILSQSFSDFEIIIQDDASVDDTEKIVRSLNDQRIKFFKNEVNLGYPQNLEEARKKARGEIIFLMGQDDILGKDTLLKTVEVFNLLEDIGAVTRPYYWFDQEISKPVRAKEQLNEKRDEIIKITDDPKKIIKMFSTLDQLSGLAFRRKFMDIPFHPDIFPCHVYPFASIIKKHPVVFLRDYTIAVRINTSQSRTKSSIYDKSPIQSWVEMFDTVFSEKKYEKIRKYCIKNFVAINYLGLVQIRNYARWRYLIREIKLLLKYRWQNAYNPKFWFFIIGCLIMPPFILRYLVDWYKSAINSKRLKFIKFEYLI